MRVCVWVGTHQPFAAGGRGEVRTTPGEFTHSRKNEGCEKSGQVSEAVDGGLITFDRFGRFGGPELSVCVRNVRGGVLGWSERSAVSVVEFCGVRGGILDRPGCSVASVLVFL